MIVTVKLTVEQRDALLALVAQRQRIDTDQKWGEIVGELLYDTSAPGGPDNIEWAIERLGGA